jgi:hypothetical protein
MPAIARQEKVGPTPVPGLQSGFSSLHRQHKPLGAAIVDDLSRVEIAFRVCRHVMDDVEVTWLRTTLS